MTSRSAQKEKLGCPRTVGPAGTSGPQLWMMHAPGRSNRTPARSMQWPHVPLAAQKPSESRVSVNPWSVQIVTGYPLVIAATRSSQVETRAAEPKLVGRGLRLQAMGRATLAPFLRSIAGISTVRAEHFPRQHPDCRHCLDRRGAIRPIARAQNAGDLTRRGIDKLGVGFPVIERFTETNFDALEQVVAVAVAKRDAIADLLRRVIRKLAQNITPRLVEQNRIGLRGRHRRAAARPGATLANGWANTFWVASMPRQPQRD